MILNSTYEYRFGTAVLHADAATHLKGLYAMGGKLHTVWTHRVAVTNRVHFEVEEARSVGDGNKPAIVLVTVEPSFLQESNEADRHVRSSRSEKNCGRFRMYSVLGIAKVVLRRPIRGIIGHQDVLIIGMLRRRRERNRLNRHVWIRGESGIVRELSRAFDTVHEMTKTSRR